MVPTILISALVNGLTILKILAQFTMENLSLVGAASLHAFAELGIDMAQSLSGRLNLPLTSDTCLFFFVEVILIQIENLD